MTKKRRKKKTLMLGNYGPLKDAIWERREMKKDPLYYADTITMWKDYLKPYGGSFIIAVLRLARWK